LARERHLQQTILSRAVTSVLLAILLVGGVSCDLFETRKPNSPGTNRFPCAPLNSPNNVFTNIVQAYGRGDGLPCYLSTLSDVQLLFDFDDADSLASPDQFKNWTKNIEERVAQNIASGADSFFLQFKVPYTPVLTQADVETRRYAYEIRFKGEAIPDTLFQGLAEITVRKNAGGEWLVGEWVDRRDPDGTTSLTWGYLRQSYRIGF
jgi:hypothetical protein